ncbi:MAG: GNAT family N-acetyltransferase [Promethearchaeota archaeon]
MEDILIIRQPKTKNELRKEFELRWNILFKPWNQPKGSERDLFEEKAKHFIAILNDEIIGTARFHKIKERIGQVKYVAVSEKFRLKGIGQNLLEAIQYSAKNQGYRFLVLNARESSIDFFKKQDFELVGEAKPLFDKIKQFKMKKRINIIRKH